MEEKAIEQLNLFGDGNFQETLGLKIISIDRLNLACIGEFSVTKTLSQPMGLINGGATAGIMETIGSSLTTLYVDYSKEYNLGLNLNVNHIRSAKIGTKLIAKAKIIHKGRKTHIVKIDIETELGKLISTGTLTNIILPLDNL